MSLAEVLLELQEADAICSNCSSLHGHFLRALAGCHGRERSPALAVGFASFGCDGEAAGAGGARLGEELLILLFSSSLAGSYSY